MRQLIQAGVLAFSVLAASVAEGADPAATPAPGTRPGLQQLFDTASQAEVDGDCAKALPIFDSLAHDPRLKPGSLPAAAVALRGGICMVAAGRQDDGEASITAGLPTIRNAGPDFAIDVWTGDRTLGDLALLRGDHDAALSHYQAALSVSSGEARIEPLLRLAMASAFDGGAQPLAYADEALQVEMAAPKPNQQLLARIHDIHARILLNQGQVVPAYAELKQALDLSGGLSLRQVTQAQATLRGDLAQAALLAGDRGRAREYLAYTGEGRVTGSPFAMATNLQAPECGSDTGLKPEDSAIVEFAIANDGSVSAAQTVYSPGNYTVAAAFAKAVNHWLWRPEDIAKLPAFFRTMTRVEVRCTNRGDDMQDVTTPLYQRFFQWADAVLPQSHVQTLSSGARLQTLKDEAATAVDRGDSKVAAAALGAWALEDTRYSAATLDGFDKAIALGQQAGIPPEAINALRVLKMPKQLFITRVKSGHAYSESLSDWANFLPIADESAMAGDPLAADTLLLLAIPRHPTPSDRETSNALARRVADDGRLPDHFPLRQVALLWLANQSAADRKLDEAQAYFQRTGLNEQQCALIGVRPAMHSSGVSTYPDEALKMGFEGWVLTEFNINADGTTVDTRPLIAYPPFVFADAAKRRAGSLRYESSYRPAGGQACSAEEMTINFVINKP